jgi:hypothetical protein
MSPTAAQAADGKDVSPTTADQVADIDPSRCDRHGASDLLGLVDEVFLLIRSPQIMPREKQQ